MPHATQQMWRKRNFCLLLLDCKSLHQLWKPVWRFYKNWKWNHHMTKLFHSWAYTQRTQYPIKRDMSTPLFIDALFPMARKWKEPRNQFTNEFAMKIWNIQKIKCYQALKKNKITTLTGKSIDLQYLMPIKVMQSQEEKSHIFFLIWKS